MGQIVNVSPQQRQSFCTTQAHVFGTSKTLKPLPLAAVVGLWGGVLIFFHVCSAHCSTCLRLLLLLPLCYVANDFGEVGHYSFPKDMHSGRVCGNACCIHDLPLEFGQRGGPGNPILRKYPQATGSLPSPMCFRTLLHLSCVFKTCMKAQHMPLCKSNWSTGTQVI